MGLFSNLTTEGLEENQDRVGGFSAIAADAYTGKIKMAYAGKSAKGAQFVQLMLDFNGKEYRETVYITNQKGENFFLNKNDKTKKVALPGFTIIDHICLVTTDKDLSSQETEEKVVNIYDFDQKKDIPKSVPVLIELLGKEVTLGILNTLENQSDKAGDGTYVPNEKERNVNSIDKVFHHPTHMTVVEVQNGATEAGFYEKWLEANKGKVRDKRTYKAGQQGSSGKPGASAPQAGGGETAPRKSLFGNK